jgi:hypothetical protein
VDSTALLSDTGRWADYRPDAADAMTGRGRQREKDDAMTLKTMVTAALMGVSLAVSVAAVSQAGDGRSDGATGTSGCENQDNNCTTRGH